MHLPGGIKAAYLSVKLLDPSTVPTLLTLLADVGLKQDVPYQ